MKLIFARSNTIGSWLIRLLTFSKWSHVAAIMPNGLVIEATWPEGVRRISMEALLSSYPHTEVREINISPVGIDWLERQVGKRYDVTALFTFLNPWRKWRQDDKWFCSELIAQACGVFQEASRVSPQMLYLVSNPA